MKSDVEISLGCQVIDIYHDKKIKKLNFELVYVGEKVKDDESMRDKVADGDGYFAIRLEDWTPKKGKKILTLHMLDAIEIKSVIDGLVYEAGLVK